MSSKIKQKKTNNLVNIDNLSLAMDVTTGKVILGIAVEGVIDEKQPTKDVSSDFFGLMNEILLIQTASLSKQKKVIKPTESEKNFILRG